MSGPARIALCSGLAIALVAACHSSTPPAQPGGPAATAAPAPHTPTDDLSLLPVDSDVVFGINFAQLSQSAIWQKYIASKISSTDSLQKFKTICGFDPLASLQAIAFGIRDAKGTPNGVIVLRGYDRAKSMTCFDQDGLAEVEKDGTKVTIDGGTVLLTDPKGHDVGFTFVDDKTAVIVIGPDATSSIGIARATSGDHGLKTSHAFLDFYATLNRNDSMWMLVRGAALSEMESVGVKPKALFGSINVTNQITLDARLRLGTKDEATQLVSLTQSQIASPQVKNFFDKLEVALDGTDAHFTVAMSEDKVVALVQLFGGMFMRGATGP